MKPGASALPGLESLETAITEMLDRLLSRERTRLLTAESEEHKRRVEILEARINKLNSALSNTEEALKKMAKKSFYVHITCAIAVPECTFHNALRRSDVTIENVLKNRFEPVRTSSFCNSSFSFTLHT